jgi:hypothetical protein
MRRRRWAHLEILGLAKVKTRCVGDAAVDALDDWVGGWLDPSHLGNPKLRRYVCAEKRGQRLVLGGTSLIVVPWGKKDAMLLRLQRMGSHSLPFIATDRVSRPLAISIM